jgi:hypothetical protein
MRTWIQLIESAEMDYPAFEAEWAEYVSDLLDEPREINFYWYDEVRQQLEHQFAQREFMYRIIHVAPTWIDELRRNAQQPLGVHWSISDLSWQPSTDPYDRRFSYPSGKKLTVTMTARMPPYQAIDWNACVASAMATSEDELRVTEGAMIEVTSASVDGHNLLLNLTRPA